MKSKPELEYLAPELKLMILKESDAESIRSLVLASPSFYRIFGSYSADILEHSVSYSSGVCPEVLNDALAAASLPYPPGINNADKEIRKDEAAAGKAVRLWRENKFAFPPNQKGNPPTHNRHVCAVPGFNPGLGLRRAADLARLSFYIEKFIEDYVAKARCDPLKDFNVYNNVPYWAHSTLKSLNPSSPTDLEKKKKAIRLTDHELIKFQRAFFRFEFYARVHAHTAIPDEYDADQNPLIKLAPSQTEEVACAYSYLYSLQMLALEETDVGELKKGIFDGGRTFPVYHLSKSGCMDNICPTLNTKHLPRFMLANGISRLWHSLKEPYQTRRKLVYDDVHRVTQARNTGNSDFMKAVLNADPLCCHSCCGNTWGLVSDFQVYPFTSSNYPPSLVKPFPLVGTSPFRTSRPLSTRIASSPR